MTLLYRNCPGDGPIDLEIHDLPHSSSAMEWWYVNSHLETMTGLSLSLFASFFRIIREVNQETGEVVYAHALVWAISDVDSGRYYAESRVDQSSPRLILDELERHKWKSTSLLWQALREVLEKGQIPHPDRLIEGTVTVHQERLYLDYGGNRFRKLDDGNYQLTLSNDELEVGCQLTFHPQKGPVRHGDNGVVRGTSGADMFYYFIPRFQVEGVIKINDQSLPLKEGSGWYDHEFSLSRNDRVESIKHDHNVAWNWISVQLDNGYEVTAFDLFDGEMNDQRCACWAIVVDPGGNWTQYQSFTFGPLESWISTRTLIDYPILWQLKIPEIQLALTVKAAFDRQEFITIIAAPSFWEGRVNIRGTMNGEAVTGLGFVECTCFNKLDTLDRFFDAAERQAQKAVQDLLPTYEQSRRSILRGAYNYFLTGLDLERDSLALIKSIREMTDRGGKVWHSYALLASVLACIDAVGGDSQNFACWLAIPALLHAGSSIIDDVENPSSVHLNGSARHSIDGETLAISNGSAAYLLGQVLMHKTRLTGLEKLRLYGLYSEALRAAHAGQTAATDGLDALMPHIVESGEGELLEARALAIHKLKSAVPVRSLAMMGATVGGGTAVQIEAIGHFFEMSGLASQIIDDLLSLRGFDNNMRRKGEDISAGKITMPIAKAMSRLSLKERRKLWGTLSSKPTDSAVIAAVIKQLENCGAIDSCQEQAQELVESAWKKMDPLLRSSRAKIILRAFGWYVIERRA